MSEICKDYKGIDYKKAENDESREIIQVIDARNNLTFCTNINNNGNISDDTK